MPKTFNFEEEWSKSPGEAIEVLDIGGDIQVGILTMPPRSRLPEEGFSIHDEYHEFAYVVDGDVILVTNGDRFPASTGEFVYNEPGTPHYTLNNTNRPARILWMLIRK
ncbi:cupin domain-containing protein [Thermococcus sp. 21S7]|uniref:cupin domain-containing protein n=1 Tax=Thermococcus sp. 21S7 TaxID=1638221 RepID=UPI001439CF24|nr:cupin domain-containing protein [Thermococcus sp. 21S7]NJE61716.1 cupin domain-containing protein [Thermococcus sp. 21S7]